MAATEDSVVLSNKEEVIQRYLSVSFPLRRIKVNSPYGIRKDPFTGKKRMHKGIDLHARGDKVYAMMVGEVIKTGSDRQSGNYVMLRHDEYVVSYCHLAKVCVKRGTTVHAGSVVGISGNTGSRSTGEHLHLSCKYRGKHINPSILLNFVREVQRGCIEKLKAMM